MKTCPICEKKHNNKTYCSQECHYEALGRKPIVKCDYCGKEVRIKKTNKNKLHFCDRNCYEKYRGKEVKEKKKEFIRRYEDGEMIKDIAKSLGFTRQKLGYYRRKWKLKPRKKQDYYDFSILKREAEKKRKKIDFEKAVKENRLSYLRAHWWASKEWKITDRPCDVCGWNKAERDMHLIRPRVLQKENAISLCPNCHRLVHRNKIEISKGNQNKILIKKI